MASKKPGNQWKTAHAELFASNLAFVNAVREVLGLDPIPANGKR